jgi:hypothetical protein
LSEFFNFLPEFLQQVMVSITQHFVGQGWHLTLGALFMLVVIFLPGGVMEGVTLVNKYIRLKLGLVNTASKTKQSPIRKNLVDPIAQSLTEQPNDSQKEEGK